MSDKINYELAYVRRFNLGNFNHKEMSIKLSGDEDKVTEQFEQKKQQLINFLSQLEQIVELADEANKLKNKLDVEANKEV